MNALKRGGYFSVVPEVKDQLILAAKAGSDVVPSLGNRPAIASDVAVFCPQPQMTGRRTIVTEYGVDVERIRAVIIDPDICSIGHCRQRHHNRIKCFAFRESGLVDAAQQAVAIEIVDNAVLVHVAIVHKDDQPRRPASSPKLVLRLLVGAWLRVAGLCCAEPRRLGGVGLIAAIPDLRGRNPKRAALLRELFLQARNGRVEKFALFGAVE